MYNGERIAAIVPARKEQERLVDKNILPFGGCTLLEWKLRQLKKVPELDRVIVSSDDEKILEIAKREGVDVQKRPTEYAARENPFGKFVSYICGQVEAEHILWACVTSPFVDEGDYSPAIKLYFEKLKEGYDSLITVRQMKRFILDKNGAVNFKRGLLHRNSEDLSPLYLFTNGIVLAPREKIICWNYNWGHIPYMLEVDKKTSIDISDAFDYQCAKLLLGGKNV